MAAAGARSLVVGPVLIGPLRSLLERFRRNAGVPASVGGELSAELAPVFALLDEIEREVALLRARSEAGALARLHETDEEAAGILSEARRLSAEERVAELRFVLHGARTECDMIRREAEARAEAVRRAGAERLPELIAAVVGRVREDGP
jgi:hypothetical protein